jgi:hypothetical protein
MSGGPARAPTPPNRRVALIAQQRIAHVLGVEVSLIQDPHVRDAISINQVVDAAFRALQGRRNLLKWAPVPN